MNLDLKIGWNDLNDKCQDTIKKLHKLGCKVNIIYPMFETKKYRNCVSDSTENRMYDGDSNNERTFTTSVNDFIYQNSSSGTEIGSGAG